MSEIQDVLDKVDRLNRTVKPREAEEILRALLETIGPAELRVWEKDLTETIGRFMPKRRKALMQRMRELNASEGVAPTSTPSGGPESPPRAFTATGPPKVPVELRAILDGLSKYHIFQWATFYRDDLGSYFSTTLKSLDASENTVDLTAVQRLFADHAIDIFTKGYSHTRRSADESQAITKSLSGLQRFLDLPVEFYSAHISTGLNAKQAANLRNLTSSMLSGVLQGYLQLELRTMSGSSLLATYLNSWLHVTAFLNRVQLSAILEGLGQNDFSDAALGTLIPLAGAIDQMVVDSAGYIPLPVLSQYSDTDSRLTVSLQPPAYAPERQLVEIQCYLNPERVTPAMLLDATSRRIGGIIATLRPDTRATVASNELFNDLFVTVMEDTSATERRLLSVLETGIYRRHSPRMGGRPLEYNFAREFPLNNPFLTRYVFVVRTSVRDLLRTFERRNGVRLWCSVRRSGKTTAGLDLATTTGESTLVNQTCDSTGQSRNDSLLYDEICSALDSGRRLPTDFLQSVLERCAEGIPSEDQRTVLVLDEYETLFGQLRTAVAYDERLRYTVAQPLLNQMVAFARDNLLVFLGQQPTAHFILMDQNQLSPYVAQDPFPLFRNSADPNDEFSEFLQRVFAHRATFDRSFADRIFVETAGHPFLTVNLLVEFVEWLIRNKRPTTQLNFTGDDASAFAKRALRRDRLSTSPEYEFFRNGAIPQALSPASKRATPWLYAMYSIIRMIAREDPVSFTCARAEFADLVDRLDLSGLGMGADTLLTTGAQSNFLSYNDRVVSPRIRLLGRIAAVSVPAVTE